MDKRMWIIVGLLKLLLSGILIYKQVSNNYDNSDLKLHVFNAGKADSMLLYNDNLAVLIDTGEEELGDSIVEFLNDLGISKLDYLIITHFDKDHVGGASKVINSIEIGSILQSNYVKESRVYDKYLEAIKNNNVKVTTVTKDVTFNFGDIRFVVNGPDVEEYVEKPSNNSSLITKVYFKDNSLLFMGDAENLRISEYLNENNETFDFLKVPYHGHYQDKLEELINRVSPKYAVITSSDKEIEDEETLEILNKYNVKTYLAREGEIDFTFDGTSIEVKQ